MRRLESPNLRTIAIEIAPSIVGIHRAGAATSTTGSDHGASAAPRSPPLSYVFTRCELVLTRRALRRDLAVTLLLCQHLRVLYTAHAVSGQRLPEQLEIVYYTGLPTMPRSGCRLP